MGIVVWYDDATATAISPTPFSRFFSIAVGMTPSAYRKKFGTQDEQ